VVSVPYAYTTVGFGFGVALQVLVMTSMLFSCRLYLETRRRLKCKSSFTDVASKCLGHISSLVINFLLAFCIFGVLSLLALLLFKI
jgi:amino acid permease